MSPAELLKELIAIPSVNPMGRDMDGPECFETRVTEFLIGYFTGLGVDPIVQEVAPGRSNVFAVYRNPDSPVTLLLDAHQDTVPVDGMTIPPFTPTETEGRIYGRGACDVKGGMASMLSAFSRLVKERPEGAASVIMSCTADEESTTLGIHGLTDWLDSEQCPLPRPDGAVIAEPTELDLVVAHRGAVRWKLRTRGRACHSSQPDNGINAIYRMAHVLERLEQYAQRLPGEVPAHPLCGPATLSVGRIGGGVSVNTVPDECWIEIDRRVIPGEDADEVYRQVQAALADLPFEVLHDEPWLKGPALPDDVNGSLADLVMTHVTAVAGERRRMGVPYGTHASRTAKAGIPSVVFGPGSIAQAHTEDEWIEAAQLDVAADVYYRVCVGANTL